MLFLPFFNPLGEAFNAVWATGRVNGPGSHSCSILWWWQLVELCRPLYYCSSPDPGLSLKVYQLPWPNCCLFPSGLSSEDCTPTFHCRRICWGYGKHQTASLAPSLCHLVLFPILLPLLASICAPSDVSMYESLRCVCVLIKEFFVKL